MPDLPMQIRIGMRVQFRPGHWFSFRGIVSHAQNPTFLKPLPPITEGLSKEEYQLIANTLMKLERTLNEHCPELRTTLSLEPVR